MISLPKLVVEHVFFLLIYLFLLAEPDLILLLNTRLEIVELATLRSQLISVFLPPSLVELIHHLLSLRLPILLECEQPFGHSVLNILRSLLPYDKLLPENRLLRFQHRFQLYTPRLYLLHADLLKLISSSLNPSLDDHVVGFGFPVRLVSQLVVVIEVATQLVVCRLACSTVLDRIVGLTL
jgi:hypothetical protein